MNKIEILSRLVLLTLLYLKANYKGEYLNAISFRRKVLQSCRCNSAALRFTILFVPHRNYGWGNKKIETPGILRLKSQIVLSDVGSVFTRPPGSSRFSRSIIERIRTHKLRICCNKVSSRKKWWCWEIFTVARGPQFVSVVIPGASHQYTKYKPYVQYIYNFSFLLSQS